MFFILFFFRQDLLNDTMNFTKIINEVDLKITLHYHVLFCICFKLHYVYVFDLPLVKMYRDYFMISSQKY